jgi:ferredoxin--NADP+ reductase
MLNTKATVTDVIEVHSALRRMVLQFDEFSAIPTAGQFVNLGLENAEGAIVKRAYSISSPIINKDGSIASWQALQHEFYVARVEDGQFTPSLFDLKLGDKILAQSRAVGHYILPEGIKKSDTVIFASTGTGIAPHNAMLRQLLASGHEGALVVLDCVRYKQDLAYQDSFDQLDKKVIYIPLVTRESEKKMYIQDFVKSNELESTFGVTLDPKHVHVFCCGNPAMIGIPRKNRETGMYDFPETQGLIEVLMSQFGLTIFRPSTGGQIHFEKYW